MFRNIFLEYINSNYTDLKMSCPKGSCNNFSIGYWKHNSCNNG